MVLDYRLRLRRSLCKKRETSLTEFHSLWQTVMQFNTIKINNQVITALGEVRAAVTSIQRV
jgi:hypothetical protein